MHPRLYAPTLTQASSHNHCTPPPPQKKVYVAKEHELLCRVARGSARGFAELDRLRKGPLYFPPTMFEGAVDYGGGRGGDRGGGGGALGARGARGSLSSRGGGGGGGSVVWSVSHAAGPSGGPSGGSSGGSALDSAAAVRRQGDAISSHSATSGLVPGVVVARHQHQHQQCALETSTQRPQQSQEAPLPSACGSASLSARAAGAPSRLGHDRHHCAASVATPGSARRSRPATAAAVVAAASTGSGGAGVVVAPTAAMATSGRFLDGRLVVATARPLPEGWAKIRSASRPDRTYYAHAPTRAA